MIRYYVYSGNNNINLITDRSENKIVLARSENSKNLYDIVSANVFA